VDAWGECRAGGDRAAAAAAAAAAADNPAPSSRAAKVDASVTRRRSGREGASRAEEGRVADDANGSAIDAGAGMCAARWKARAV
jgi:hypothetical protein